MSNGESSSSKGAANAVGPDQATDIELNKQAVEDDGCRMKYKMVTDLLMHLMSNGDSDIKSTITNKIIEAFIQVDTPDSTANDTTPEQRKDSKGKGVSGQNNGGHGMEWEAT